MQGVESLNFTMLQVYKVIFLFALFAPFIFYILLTNFIFLWLYSLAALNATCANIYQTVERGSASKAKVHKILEEYYKCEEQRNKVAKVAKAMEEGNAKLEPGKTELQK